MAKSREKVQQAGFWDEEVAKPDHDAICLWAYENPEPIVRAVCPDRYDQPWLSDEVHLANDPSVTDAEVRARAFVDENPRPNPQVVSKTIECVLKSFSGYQDKTVKIVGYADLLIQVRFPIVRSKYRPGATRYESDAFDGYEIGWSDRPYKDSRILVEAKTVIPSVGELMRQIQLYRTAFDGKVVVISPDDKYAKILNEQGVTFIKYAP